MLASVKPGSSMGFSTLDPLITNVNRIEYKYEPANTGRQQDTFLSRATRMLQGEPADEPDSDDNDESEVRAKQKKTINSPARSDASADILSTAAATLVDGAVPVRGSTLPTHSTC